ncbi:sugar ABC transporter permease [Spirochaetia bacterium]|nr:sugar ABC transporter permease [Spirochaetia bacterium]
MMTLSRAFTKNIKHYLMLLPFFVVFVLFFLWPLFFGVSIAFTNWNGIRTPEFTGFNNFIRVWSNGDFIASFKNLVIFAILTVAIGVSLSLLVAMVASSLSNKQSLVFRSLYFLPMVLPMVLSASIWRWLLSPDIGLLNIIAVKIGFQSVNWITTPGYAMAATVLVDFWRASGFNIMIFMIAIKDVPQELYDAAEVDGANMWQKMFRITLPQLEPIVFLILTNGLIGALQIFDIPWVLSKSGLDKIGSVGTVMTYPTMMVVGLTFGRQRLGEASAYATYLLFLTLIITGAWFIIRSSRRRRDQ